MLEVLVHKKTGEMVVVKPKGSPWGKKETDKKTFVIKEITEAEFDKTGAGQAGAKIEVLCYPHKQDVFNYMPDGRMYKVREETTKRVKATAVGQAQKQITASDMENKPNAITTEREGRGSG